MRMSSLFAAFVASAVVFSAAPVEAQSPVSIFGSAMPANPVDPDTAGVTLGVRFQSTQKGVVKGIRFYRGRSNRNGYTVRLWDLNQHVLGHVRVSRDPAPVPGWQEVDFATPVQIAAGKPYVASYYTSNGQYADDQNGLTNAVSTGPLTAYGSAQIGGNGVYVYANGYPFNVRNDSNYWVDVAFVASSPPLQSISGINLSNNQITENQPAGTVVGQETVAMSPTAPAFSGSLSLNDTNFSLSGTNLVTNAPLAVGTYSINVTATESGVTSSPFTEAETITVAAATPPPPPDILPPDRNAGANWRRAGMLSVGGIPNRTTVCATVNPKGGGADDTTNIQNAVNSCPLGQVVNLSAGVFTIAEGNYVLLNKGITLRGAGPGVTTLQRTDGAKLGTYIPGSNPSPMIIAGPQRWNNNTTSTNLTADGAVGTNTVQVASTAGLSVGQVVLLDEASGAGWQPDVVWTDRKIWASPDYRVVWQKHNPYYQNVDDFDASTYPYTNGSAGCWFSNCDRPTNELKQISAISGNTITFDSPITISYRASHQAHLSHYQTPHTQNAGIENLTVSNGDDGNIGFQWCAYCWAQNVENTLWLSDGFGINSSFRVQLEGVYVHDAVWPVNGGGGYAISMAWGSSEILIENSISVLANKVMVDRSSGAGSVVGYNYMDDGYINGQGSWVEIGLNASHMVGAHHVLFESNYGFNIDSDQTHGNSIYLTFFRNYASGYRRPFTALDGTQIDDSTGCCGPLRAAGAHAYAYWLSFIGNVLGTPGHTSGWVYDAIGRTNYIPSKGIWTLGTMDITPQGYDANVAQTSIRDGNFDYLSNTVVWSSNDTAHTLPNSLYLTQKPAFFNAGSGYTWPWVNPTGSPQLFTLPAKARYDAGTPFVQP